MDDPSRDKSSTPGTTDTATRPAEGDSDLAGMAPLERLSLVTVLEHLTQRLSALEARLATKAPDEKKGGMALAETIKVIFSSWPAFGLLFLLLFYAPLRDAINAIPDKVKSANEIGAFGMSLKTTLRVEAEKIGAFQLSETLPALSPPAVELLLRASGYNGLVGYTQNTEGLLDKVWLPDERLLATLSELESKELILIQIGGPPRSGGVAALRAAIAAFETANPGKEAPVSFNGQITWELNPPKKAAPPQLGWELTNLGKKAVEVILTAISSQLAPPPAAGAKPSS